MLKNSLLFVVAICTVLCSENISYAQEIGRSSKLFINRKVTAREKEMIRRLTRSIKNPFRERFGNASRVAKKADRSTGNKILDLAVIYWVDQDSFTLSYLQDWCKEAIKVEQWGNNNDLEISHLLFALSIVYDWHRDKLGKELKQDLKEFIYRHAKYQYEYAVKTQGGWWSDSYWQNHCWINYTSILASGMALLDDFPETKEWIAFARQKIEKSISVQVDEGSNHEGLNYSVYGNIWLVRALTLLQVFDEDIFKRSEYLKNYHDFFKAFSVNDEFNTFFDTGDSPQYLWYSPCEIFLKLYQEYNLEAYRELYLYFLKECKNKEPSIFTAVYGMPGGEKAKGVTISKLPYFSDDMGVFIDKRFKEDKISESFLFKSGIPGGRTAHVTSGQHSTYHLNRGHNHPDQNHFMIWYKDNFLISDTGYTNKKMTKNHNTLLVDGIGQLGEGGGWFKDAEVEKKVFSKSAGLQGSNIHQKDDVTIVSADAAEFYPEEAGLKRFNRTIVWIKALGFIVLDDIVTEEPKDLSILFHSDVPMKKKGVNSYEFKELFKMFGMIKPLYPENALIKKKVHSYVSHSSENSIKIRGEVLSVSDNTQKKHKQFITTIMLGKNRPDFKIEKKENGEFRIDVSNKDVAFVLTWDGETCGVFKRVLGSTDD